MRPGKVAKLDRGVTINVPIFTKNGESIRVKIETEGAGARNMEA